MLDARITIVNGTMKKFDRKSKTVIVRDHQDNILTLNYDLLIIGVGLVDNTIKDLAREKASRPDLQKEAKEQPKDAKSIEDGILFLQDYAEIRNIWSIDDPYLYKVFKREENEALRNPLDPIEMLTHKKRPQRINIYGRSIHTISFAAGLIRRGVSPAQINLVLPPMSYKNRETFENNADRVEYENRQLDDLDAFDGDNLVRNKVFEVLRSMGITIYENYVLLDLVPDENDTKNNTKKLKGILVIPAEKVRPDHREREKEFHEIIPGSILLTASCLDIEERLFDTIQENGLVYNGRLIVKNNFETVDDSIFACGQIVEFSQQYKNYALGRSLRLDRYSGRELGQRLGQCVLEALKVMAPVVETDEKFEKLPSFEMPVGICAYLPSDMLYVRIAAVPEGIPDKVVGLGDPRFEYLRIDRNCSATISSMAKATF